MLAYLFTTVLCDENYNVILCLCIMFSVLIVLHGVIDIISNCSISTNGSVLLGRMVME